MQNVIGIAYGIVSIYHLFHCKECALQHYVRPVTLLAQLQVAGSYFSLK